jgi:hypothetical protein
MLFVKVDYDLQKAACSVIVCLEGAYSGERAHRITNLLVPTHGVLVFHTLLRIIKKKFLFDAKRDTSANCMRTQQIQNFSSACGLCSECSICFMSVLIEASFCNWRCLFLAVFFVFMVAGIHHQSYFGITTRILHTQNLLHLVLVKQNVCHKGSAILKISAEFANQ